MTPDIKYKLELGSSFIPSKELKAIKGLTWAGDENHLWYVAYEGDKQIGCVGMFIKDGTARFKTDAVLPDYRGRGVYRALFALRESLALSKGASGATTFSNADSRATYTKNGFTPKGKESDRGVQFMTKLFDKPPKCW
jgi:GNAT superfamily N-acetyltransferase